MGGAPPPDYDFAATGFVPAGVVVALGTNDYSKGPNATFDAEFTAGYVAFMTNVVRTGKGGGGFEWVERGDDMGEGQISGEGVIVVRLRFAASA